MLIDHTVNRFYRSQLDFEVGYGLPADMVLGNDWVAPCQPTLVEDHSSLQQPSLQLLDSLAPPHYWYPVVGMSPSFVCFMYSSPFQHP